MQQQKGIFFCTQSTGSLWSAEPAASSLVEDILPTEPLNSSRASLPPPPHPPTKYSRHPPSTHSRLIDYLLFPEVGTRAFFPAIVLSSWLQVAKKQTRKCSCENLYKIIEYRTNRMKKVRKLVLSDERWGVRGRLNSPYLAWPLGSGCGKPLISHILERGRQAG